MLKGSGYLISTLSVFLIGAVAWRTAVDEPAMLALLALGMLLSIVGMFLRWLSFRKDQRDKARIKAQVRQTPRSTAGGGDAETPASVPRPGLVAARRS